MRFAWSIAYQQLGIIDIDTVVHGLSDDIARASAIFKKTAIRAEPSENKKIRSVLVANGPEGELTREKYAAARGVHGCLPVNQDSIILWVEMNRLLRDIRAGFESE